MEVDWGQAIKVAVGGFVTVALALSLLAAVLFGVTRVTREIIARSPEKNEQ